MNVRTFYKIYYEHRIKKSSIILKLYILIFFPINYFLNKIFFESKKNLDLLAKKIKVYLTRILNFYLNILIVIKVKNT